MGSRQQLPPEDEPFTFNNADLIVKKLQTSMRNLRMRTNSPVEVCTREKKFTSGKWKRLDTGDGTEIYSHDGPVVIAGVFGDSGRISDEEYRANARLISKAPELVKRLEEALVLLDEFARNSQTLPEELSKFSTRANGLLDWVCD